MTFSTFALIGAIAVGIVWTLKIMSIDRKNGMTQKKKIAIGATWVLALALYLGLTLLQKTVTEEWEKLGKELIKPQAYPKTK